MFRLFVPLLALLFLAAAPVGARDMSGTAVLTPEMALLQVAGRYRGRALSIERDRPEDHEGKGFVVYEIRWLTVTDNVLKIRISGSDGRFLEVEGVGQHEARILP